MTKSTTLLYTQGLGGSVLICTVPLSLLESPILQVRFGHPKGHEAETSENSRREGQLPRVVGLRQLHIPRVSAENNKVG